MRRMACVVLLVGSIAGSARADAIGPAPAREDCARGAVSSVANMLQHGQHAYCAPALCREGDACREGMRCAVLELEIGEHYVSPSLGHGAVPQEPVRGVALAEVLRECDAPDASEVIAPRVRHDDAVFVLMGPTTEHVP